MVEKNFREDLTRTSEDWLDRNDNLRDLYRKADNSCENPRAEFLLRNLKRAEGINLKGETYALMKKTIDYLSYMDIFQLGIADLDLIYSMAISEEGLSYMDMLELISNSHLSSKDKEDLNLSLLEASKSSSIGILNKDFKSFIARTTEEDSQLFIRVLGLVLKMDDEEEILDLVEESMGLGISGLDAFTAGPILHLLRPEVFPLISLENLEDYDILSDFGLFLNSSPSLNAYIENTRNLKNLRDKSLKFKDYRILALGLSMDREIEGLRRETSDSDYWPYFNDIDRIRRQVDLSFKMGKSIIIVGRAGMGKTSLAKAIARSYRKDYEMYLMGMDDIEKKLSPRIIEKIIEDKKFLILDECHYNYDIRYVDRILRGQDYINFKSSRAQDFKVIATMDLDDIKELEDLNDIASFNIIRIEDYDLINSELLLKLNEIWQIEIDGLGDLAAYLNKVNKDLSLTTKMIKEILSLLSFGGTREDIVELVFWPEILSLENDEEVLKIIKNIN